MNHIRSLRRRTFDRQSLADLGTFLRAAITRDDQALAECQRRRIPMQRAQSGVTGTAGGFLVPSQLGEPLQALLDENGVFRRFARESSMARSTKDHPRQVGGATIYNPDQNDEIAGSTFTYESIGLNARKLAALARVSSELAEDAADLAADLAIEFARAMAQKEDQLGFAGDGTSASFGVRGIAYLLADGSHAGGVVAASNHDTLGEIDIADLSTLLAKLPTRAHAGAAWYCSLPGYAHVFCRLAAGAGGIQVVNNEPRFWNIPIRVTPTLPTATTDISGQAMLLLGDLHLSSLFGNRRQVSVVASEERHIELDQIAVRATERIDIVNHDLGDANTAGAVVALIGQ